MTSSAIMSASLTMQFADEPGNFVEQQRWNWLEQELAPGMQAAESEFVPLDAVSIIAEAKSKKLRKMK